MSADPFDHPQDLTRCADAMWQVLIEDEGCYAAAMAKRGFNEAQAVEALAFLVRLGFVKGGVI